MSNEYQVKTVTGPAVEPVTLTDVKTDLRIDHDNDDILLIGLIAAAREDAERLARRAFIQRTLELSLRAWPMDGMIRLPFPPAVNVASITYYDDANAAATMPAGDYIVVADTEPALITLAKSAIWPTATLRSVYPIRVRYTAGYGATADAVPERYKAIMRAMVAVRYENRDEMTASAERQLERLENALRVDWGW